MAEIWHAVVSGAVAGFILAFLIGPVFFALLQTSIEKGFLVGVLFALGIVLSDATFFTLAFLGISQFGKGADINQIMGIVGGGFLFLFGIQLMLKKPKPKMENADIKKNTFARSFFKGFLINSVNPAGLLYWIGVVTAVSAQYEGSDKKIFSFFITSMIVVFSTDVLKAFLAYKLKNIVTPNFMLWLNRVSGGILMLGGLKLLWDVVKNYL
ncbi:MAG: LysE family translocator [Sphingobacteriales bacterium]|nr:MAG: LysE family translocator [Sphingobacteriales bacterium]